MRGTVLTRNFLKSTFRARRCWLAVKLVYMIPMVFKVKSSSVFSEPIPHQLITAARNQRFVNNIVIIFAKMYTLTGISTLLHIGQKIVNRVPRLVSRPIILLFIVVFKYHWFKFGIQILVRMLRHNIRAYTVNRWV